MVKEQMGKILSPAVSSFNRWNRKMTVNAIMLRTFLASAFFMVSLGIFTTLLKSEGNLIKFLVVTYGTLLLLFFAYNIVSYLVNITKVAISKAVNFPIIMFLNTFLGFIAQLFFFNLALAIVIRTLAFMSHSSSLVCEVKCSIINFYYNTEIYTQINSLIWWVTLGTFAAFMIGNYAVWLRPSRK